jgi:signal transduction histidine kinase
MELESPGYLMTHDVFARPAVHKSNGAPNGSSHVVQFYEDETFLAGAVADFLAGGLATGQPCVVVATEPHRKAIAHRLKSKGFDIDRPGVTSNHLVLDARTMLSGFMAGSKPDAKRFRATLGGAIEQCLRGSSCTTARVYGEMVDVLWADGNPDGALRLEDLWNELAATHGFSLMCAYAMGNFSHETHAAHFQEICRQHTRVVPTERYTLGDDAARAIEISTLQQRARALETEIENRRELERRLLVALADAKAANLAKSQFLAVMSHELRTPLNAISGHVQLIEMGVYGEVNDAQREALTRVQRSQRHLLSLINDVLNLARIETGHVEYVVEDFPLAPLLDNVASIVEPLVSTAGLTCDVAPAPPGAEQTPIAVRADREKVQQILLNLLTNAIKFTAPGGRITVDASLRGGTPALVCVNVRDTGIGIPAAKIESVFEPFVQLQTRPSCHQGGVGLGLAISRDLARGLEGDLTATSAVGDGTTFTLTLPQA